MYVEIGDRDWSDDCKVKFKIKKKNLVGFSTQRERETLKPFNMPTSENVNNN